MDIPLVLTCDDVLLDRGESEVLRGMASTSTQMTRSLKRNIPIISPTTDATSEEMPANQVKALLARAER